MTKRCVIGDRDIDFLIYFFPPVFRRRSPIYTIFPKRFKTFRINRSARPNAIRAEIENRKREILCPAKLAGLEPDDKIYHCLQYNNNIL